MKKFEKLNDMKQHYKKKYGAGKFKIIKVPGTENKYLVCPKYEKCETEEKI